MPDGKLNLEDTYRIIRERALRREFLSYGEIAAASNVEWSKARHQVGPHLGQMVTAAAGRDWPMLSAIIVNQNDLQTGELRGPAKDGFLAAAASVGIIPDDPESFIKGEQQRVFEWAKTAPPVLGVSSGHDVVAFGGRRFAAYMGVVLDALRDLGGAARPKQVVAWISERRDVPADEGRVLKGGQTVFENRVAWARQYLVWAGLLDSQTRGVWSLTPEGQETHLTPEQALTLVKEIRAQQKMVGGDDDDDATTLEIFDNASELFSDPARKFWFGGAVWDGNDDQLERFLREGIWQNGLADRFSELVHQMRAGDRIAIKASYVQKLNLPFAINGRSASAMRIKAIGVVTENLGDGRTVRVNWQRLDQPRDWYFYTYRKTLVEAQRDTELARRLILFAFAGAPQDYDYWLSQPYWIKKYGLGPKADNIVTDRGADIVNDIAVNASPPTEYTIQSIVNDGCFLGDARLEGLLRTLRTKKNLILQGPPGTGKTWLAKRLAYALLGTRDRRIARDRLRVVQFHPSTSYEDFVRGWRPSSGGGLELVDGVFLEIVQAALAEPDEEFVLVIEEINRGNPAQIFGEMLTLLEDSKRHPDEAMELAYRRADEEQVFIPANLYIVGTMNIADRSLALVDLALRRRFAFADLEPELGDEWKQWCVNRSGIDASTAGFIEERMLALNETIAQDRSLGPQFRIGHSYVTPPDGIAIADGRKWFREVVETEIVPLLAEYWFDNAEKVAEASKELLRER